MQQIDSDPVTSPYNKDDMDSLTQITLGAAMGELTLGHKVGNRALLYGAIAGTIPDLDVLSNFVTDEMSALAFHRGFTHSFFFAATAPFLFGYLTHRLYSSRFYQTTIFKRTVLIWWMGLYLIIAGGLGALPLAVGGSYSFNTLFVMLGIGAFIFQWLYRKYYQLPVPDYHASYLDWVWLFFVAIVTHPLLDACTAYGTQLFQPFSDYRVAWNSISVVDPIYTVPFILCVAIAAFISRGKPLRKWINILGIVLSTAYLAFTFYNKSKVNQVFEQSLATEGIEYDRYMTAPTIFNNVLWHCIAEGDSVYYQGLYGLMDDQPKIQHWNVFPKNHHLLAPYDGQRNAELLKWFANDYYNIIERQDGNLQFNDLRFGIVDKEPVAENSYVFRFILTEDENGQLQATQTREDNMTDDRLETFWKRIWGSWE